MPDYRETVEKLRNAIEEMPSVATIQGPREPFRLLCAAQDALALLTDPPKDTDLLGAWELSCGYETMALNAVATGDTDGATKSIQEAGIAALRIFNMALDARKKLTEQDAELATLREQLSEERDANAKLTESLAQALIVRDSYQKAWQRAGSALVKAGFQEDTTESGLSAALAELATLRAENARLKRRKAEDDCPCTELYIAPYCPVHGG